jgi:arginine decarboxylase
MLDCLQLVHCHPGSQLSDIRAIKDAVGELAHMYAALHQLGAGLRYIDIGGGLGVDYEGTGHDLPRSLNYSLAEYASAVVYRIAAVCDQAGIEHPVILSESGRALSAYCSVLVVNALGSLRFEDREPPALPADDDPQPQPLADLVTAWRDLDGDRPMEVFHDAEQAYQQAMQLFTVGLLGLEQRALAERTLLGHLHAAAPDRYGDGEELPAAVADLPAALSDIYFCNFSVFQSLPDFWAIDQLFPIMPIHRLDEPPARSATLADITCDSDGKMDRFALPGGPSPVPAAASAARGRGLLSRRVPHRCLPGDARRPAQPVRRHARGDHPPGGRWRLVHR